MDELQDDLGYLIGQTARWLRALLAEELHFHGLDDTGYIILFYASRAGDDGVGTKALSGRAEMAFPEVTAAVQRLVRDGWLTQAPDPRDREAQIIKLTPKARSTMPMLQDAARWAIERGTNGFTAEELAELTAYLRRMQANLRQ